MKNRQGFTLIELLVVIAIIGILGGGILAQFDISRRKARSASVKETMQSMRVAAELARNPRGEFESGPAVATDDECTSLLETDPILRPLHQAVLRLGSESVRCEYNQGEPRLDLAYSALLPDGVAFCIDTSGFAGPERTARNGVCLPFAPDLGGDGGEEEEEDEPRGVADIGVIRGVWNSASPSGENWEKVQRQLADGIKDFMVKQLGLQPQGFQYYEQSIRELTTWSEQLEPHEGARVWPVFNFQATGESQWVGRYTPFVPFVDSTGRVVSSAACLTPEMFDALFTARFLALAGLARDLNNMTGAIIDMELYYPRDQHGFDNYYDACYCPSCLQSFFTLRGEPVSNPRPSDVVSQGLQADYERFWYGQLENNAREAYERIKAVNPDFKIGTATLLRASSETYLAIARGLGTAEDPVLEFTEKFYSQGYAEQGQQGVSSFFDTIRGAGVKAEIALGFWEKRFHPEQIGPHAFDAAASGRYGLKGYWIYNGSDYYEGDHFCYPFELYRDSIRRANAALDAWDGVTAVEFNPPRESFLVETPPDNCRVPMTTLRQSWPSLYRSYRPGAPPADRDLSTRRSVVYYFEASVGNQISFTIESARIGTGGDIGVWALIGPDKAIIDSGVILTDGVTASTRDYVESDAQTRGIYGLYLWPGPNNKNSVAVKSRSHEGAFGAAVPAPNNFINLRNPGRQLYLYVPPGVLEVSLTFKETSGSVTVSVYRILDEDRPETGRELLVGPEVIEQGPGETLTIALGTNPLGAVLGLVYSGFSGGDSYTDIRIDSGAEPFLSQTIGALLRR